MVEVAWGPECRKDLLATASYDASVNVYDVSMNSLLLCLKGHHHLIKVRGVLISDPVQFVEGNNWSASMHMCST